MVNLFQLLLGLTPIVVAAPLLPRGSTATNWGEVPPSSSLSWTPCFNGFTCAKLEVPLDYDDTSAGTTNIAFLRWETPNQPAMGDIILNPGGPGGSAVDWLMTSVKTLTGILGTSYNLVGMDPRGVNNSGPHLDCFPGQPWVRSYYEAQYFANYDPTDDLNLLRHWTDAGGFGDWCAQTLNRTARYANTPATARDMLTYAEALAESRGESKDEAKLNYYGVSYGSTLGTTFASLFPERVGRMIIDGVVDVEEHYDGSWLHNLRQADEALARFFELCFEAGPACAFSRNDSSAKSMQKRFDALIEDVKKAPISVSDLALVQFPIVATWVDVMSWMLLNLYDQTLFPITAGILAQLEQRKITTLLALAAALDQPKGIAPPSRCDWKGEPYGEVEARLIIACNDQHGRYNISSPEKMKQYVRDLEDVSHYLGGVWSPVITLNCRKHAFIPPENQIFKGFKETRTANPILFTTNTVDPVASYADKMAKFYPGAVVMRQEAVGHGLTVGVSNCTSAHVSTFLKTGELPPTGTVCNIKNPNPFLAGVSSAAGKRGIRRRGLSLLG